MPSDGEGQAPLGLRLDELERWYVQETLRRVGNRRDAARRLGISLSSLDRKIRRYRLPVPPGDAPRPEQAAPVLPIERGRRPAGDRRRVASGRHCAGECQRQQ